MELFSPGSSWAFVALAALAFASCANATQIVVIDPGHGGDYVAGVSDSTQGGSGSSFNNATSAKRKLLEKDLTLEYALSIQAAFDASSRARRLGVKAILTRTSDIHLGAMQRAAIAAENRAKVLLSIHFNASDHHDASGTRCFYVSRDHPRWEYTHVTNAYEARDQAFCALVAKNVAQALQPFGGNPALAGARPDSDDRREGLRLLGLARQDTFLWDCALGLLEVEFIDNPRVEEWLLGNANREAARKATAQAVVEAVCTYLESPAKKEITGPRKMR